MKTRDLADLLMLATLWGASFLFIRIGAAEFGPVALAALRCLGAALFLLPIMMLRGQGALGTLERFPGGGERIFQLGSEPFRPLVGGRAVLARAFVRSVGLRCGFRRRGLQARL